MPEYKPFNAHELEVAILRILAEGGVNCRLGRGFDGVVESILKKWGVNDTWPKQRVAEAVCSVVSRGLLYVDFSVSHQRDSNKPISPEEWSIELTDRGRAAAGDTTANPDMPQGYLEQFVRDIPQAPDIVQKYVKEALETYTQRCYMACAVMLGVAAEAAFLDVTRSFCRYLKPDEARKLLSWVNGTWRPYDQIREEFMRRLAPYRSSLPDPIKENLDIQVTAIFEIIRKYRNDAGHPTGFTMDRASCFLSLIAFAEAAKRLYALKDFFDSNADP